MARAWAREREVAMKEFDTRSWEVLNRLLEQALELEPPAIRPWLDSLAAEYRPFRPQLERMLSRQAQVKTRDFLGTLPKIDLSPEEPAHTEQPGDVIGPYRLERELGSGGMGVVWLATRTDGLVQRPVALKLPHGAWRRAGLAERMARERAILASLSHPNIAHLYDAGVTPAGQPYLAIEYVEGTRVDVYCRERQLGTRARLELFAQAAKAVAYAHGKLVVHRDLKPANMLVNVEGQVRLLDFGIAKLLEDGEARETRFTELSGRALTPDYASPEQILGEPLTVAADVYSLGVVLYELLCDQRPYKLQRDSRGALEEAILQADPPLPSDVADARRRASLRGDLDTVVLEALKKIPAERYPTVHALLDDIERHLSSRPVLARRDSGWYRARKFVARNKLAVSAAGAIALALLGGAVVATWQARVALAEKARAQEVQTFIASVFREADPMMQGGGKALSAVDLLLQAERRLDERADATPALRAEMLAIIGESLFGLQEIPQSARVVEKGLRVFGSMPAGDPQLGARLHLALSEAREFQGDVEAAQVELAATFDALKRAEDARALAVRARLHEAALGMATDDYALTERASRQAIDEATAVHGARSDEVATALMFLSKAYIFTERKPQAVDSARQGLEILLANHQQDYGHPKLIDLAPYYANALIHMGEFDAAARLLRELIASAERVFGADSNLVAELASLAVPAEMESGNLDAAASLARRSRDIYLKVAAPDTAIHAYRTRLLSQVLAAARSAEALPAAEDAVRVSVNAKAAPGAGRGSLGLALLQAERLPEADEQLGLALAGAKPGTRQHLQANRYRAALLRASGKSSAALPLLDQVIELASADPFDRPEFAAGHVERGLALLDLGQFDAAQVSFGTAATALDALHGDRMTPLRADLFVGRARLSMQRGDAAAALPDLERADAYWRDRRPGSRWADEAAQWLGQARAAQGTKRARP
jgi:serine/threonine protein kinase/tetratricopeptide (TPR) repeat protein